jgi:hypothetical protein
MLEKGLLSQLSRMRRVSKSYMRTGRGGGIEDGFDGNLRVKCNAGILMLRIL